ncbi:hypothetical protein C2I17_07560 [Niallia circulans]|nr:hypothetical protein C2I17_07560 [Niallia circulans]
MDSSTRLAIDENSVYEAGCIHTCQGLEFDYVGVIIGDDLRYENGEVITDYIKRAKTDQSLKRIKKRLKETPEETLPFLSNKGLKNIPVSYLSFPYIICLLYFGANTM